MGKTMGILLLSSLVCTECLCSCVMIRVTTVVLLTQVSTANGSLKLAVSRSSFWWYVECKHGVPHKRAIGDKTPLLSMLISPLPPGCGREGVNVTQLIPACLNKQVLFGLNIFKYENRKKTFLGKKLRQIYWQWNLSWEEFVWCV